MNIDFNQCEQYKLELPGDSVEILAVSDNHAVIKAKEYLKESSIRTKGLKLFRYPKEWVNNNSAGLIEIPFYQLT